MASPSFAIPARPTRQFHRDGLEYEGEVLFVCRPDSSPEKDAERLVAAVLTDGPYRYGDFLDLPMALYLVRDEETGDVFRVSVREGTVRLHVLPATDPPGLRAFYDRLAARSRTAWEVDRRVRE